MHSIDFYFICVSVCVASKCVCACVCVSLREPCMCGPIEKGMSPIRARSHFTEIKNEESYSMM